MLIVLLPFFPLLSPSLNCCRGWETKLESWTASASERPLFASRAKRRPEANGLQNLSPHLPVCAGDATTLLVMPASAGQSKDGVRSGWGFLLRTELASSSLPEPSGAC